MKWSLILLAIALSFPASAELLTYSVSGSIDEITPGVVSGAGLPSSFGVGDDFKLDVTIDTSQTLVDLDPNPAVNLFDLVAQIALRIGGASLIAPSQSVFVSIDCSIALPCSFYMERTVASGPTVPFDDSSIGQIGFMATFANSITGSGLGEPLVASGQEASFFITRAHLINRHMPIPGATFVESSRR